MKFVVDAHLPRRLALFLQQAGFDALHMFDLTRAIARQTLGSTNCH
jgi:predicted nuclease of predicted toxin-antitoxin system